jgi:hypothetical protein
MVKESSLDIFSSYKSRDDELRPPRYSQSEDAARERASTTFILANPEQLSISFRISIFESIRSVGDNPGGSRGLRYRLNGNVHVSEVQIDQRNTKMHDLIRRSHSALAMGETYYDLL